MDGFRESLLLLGVPGLFLIALLDSAGVPLPGGVDVVLMLLAWQRPSLFIVFALTATVGSTIGCFVLYHLGRTGGEMALRRLDPGKLGWVNEKVRENDILAMFVAVLAPPPFPTKAFILVAGFVGMSWPRFAVVVFTGRMIRFCGEAYVAVRLGDASFEALQGLYPLIGITLAVFAVVYLVVKWLRKRQAV